jgi:hypothetical protein
MIESGRRRLGGAGDSADGQGNTVRVVVGKHERNMFGERGTVLGLFNLHFLYYLTHGLFT